MNCKKLLSLLSTMIISLSCFTACSKEDDGYVPDRDRDYSDEKSEDEEKDDEAAETENITEEITELVTEMPTEPLTEAETDSSAVIQYSASELMALNSFDIVQLLDEEYDFGVEYDTFGYFSNDEKLPGLTFFVQDEYFGRLYSQSSDERELEIKARQYLNSANLPLYAIQVTDNAFADDEINAGMDYKQCSGIMGDMNCVAGSGGVLGGSFESLSMTYSNEKYGTDVTIHYDMWKMIEDHSLEYTDIEKRISDNGFISAKGMSKYNPGIMSIVVKNEEEQLPTEAPTQPPTEAAEKNEPIYSAPKFSSASASSVLDSISTSSGTYTYSAKNVLDGSTATCWCEGANGKGEGESIAILADSNQYVNELVIYNGLCTDEDLFYKNGRVKECRIEFSDGTSYETTLDGDYRNQPCVVSLPRTISTASIKLTILSTYDGTKYTDTCISDIIVN